jgi:hypothetical protein
MAKKLLRFILFFLTALIVLVGIISYTLDEPIPKGTPGVDADALAVNMEKAINKEAWNKIQWVTWTFTGDKVYVWDKYRQFLQVEWGGKRVVMSLTTKEGKAWQENQAVSGNTERKFIKTAWENFCNDSFWFIAPTKSFDKGAKRELVRLPAGERALKVTFHSGGVTPGDTYLWVFNTSDFLPKSMKMWVNILPIGGIKSIWGPWQNIQGAKIATNRRIGPLNLRVTRVLGGKSYRDCGLKADPFKVLLKQKN